MVNQRLAANGGAQQVSARQRLPVSATKRKMYTLDAVDVDRCMDGGCIRVVLLLIMLIDTLG